MLLRHHPVPTWWLPSAIQSEKSAFPAIRDKTKGRITVTPDPSGWRSPTEYARAETLSASDLGWEWLRRNEDYSRDYDTFAASASDVDAGAMTELIGERWGLRFRRRPASHPAAHAGLLAA
ncbi:transcriptional regulator domain-containing protein [Sphingomonas adhaesiva]|uniref:transcriptional regulator domain-containing protein n=1 Tax=Sphingomonas adhaesiva TaxID=28212 RepID=UPI002FF5435D